MNSRCILSKFYIKPQRWGFRKLSSCVVSYRNSTSNHNAKRIILPRPLVVSYRNSTSNHNSYNILNFSEKVVSYRNSTSNHNSVNQWANADTVVSYRNSTSNHNSEWISLSCRSLYLIEILHQTTTRRRGQPCAERLYLIEILHQTTTRAFVLARKQRCILSKFYIKPQLCRIPESRLCVVSYRNSTSNHNANAAGDMAYRVVSYRNSTSNHNVGPHID